MNFWFQPIPTTLDYGKQHKNLDFADGSEPGSATRTKSKGLQDSALGIEFTVASWKEKGCQKYKWPNG